MLACWGIEIDDPEKTFKEIDTNGGGKILFDEFAAWVISLGLDEEEEEDWLRWFSNLLNNNINYKKVYNWKDLKGFIFVNAQ